MPLNMFDSLQLTGRSSSHVVALAPDSLCLHQTVVAPYLALRAAAATAGIELQAVSGFRSFERQLVIWNGKCRGERPLLDMQGQPLQAQALSTEQRVAAILNWSALPGASRHHWGTEIDVIDAAAVLPGCAPQLLSSEFAAGGCFERLAAWLDSDVLQDYGFYRPYAQWCGGVQPEPWHLSYAPLAAAALQQLQLPLLAAALQEVEMEEGLWVQQQLPDLYARYVQNVADVPSRALAAVALKAESTLC
jgi:LAS superfamily LD-carboxypeptidase LdcB